PLYRPRTHSAVSAFLLASAAAAFTRIHARSRLRNSKRKRLRNVMAVTETLIQSKAKHPHVNRYVNVNVRASPEFREIAMKKNLILAAVILLATVWLALDAGVEAMILFN